MKIETAERPSAGSTFFKAHGHGNDYVVFAPGTAWTASPEAVRTLCDPHRGVGADGIVVVLETPGVPTLRMFNPDGGEFERSGNGLRVAAVALRRWNITSQDTFVVEVGGGPVALSIHDDNVFGLYDVSAELGRARVGPDAIEMDADAFSTALSDPKLQVVPVSVGNPHAVIFTDDLSDDALRSIGPLVATHPAIKNGTNVQLARVDDTGVQIRIWERGVGQTSASGTSASAVAVAAVSSGRVQPGDHVIRMDGGSFTVTVDESLQVVLRGPVQEIADGLLSDGFVRTL